MFRVRWRYHMRTMSRFRIVFACLILAVAGGLVRSQESARAPTVQPRIVGYLPDYRAAEVDLVAARSLTDLIVFSALPTAEGGLDLSRLKQVVPWSKLREFKTRERVRLILCVGGWDRSGQFATVAASAPKRQKFVQAVVRFCLEERFDGVDLDWEHPKDAGEQET